MIENGNLPQIGVKITNIWNHHPESIPVFSHLLILPLYRYRDQWGGHLTATHATLGVVTSAATVVPWSKGAKARGASAQLGKGTHVFFFQPKKKNGKKKHLPNKIYGWSKGFVFLDEWETKGMFMMCIAVCM